MRQLSVPIALALFLGSPAQAADVDSTTRATSGRAAWAAFGCSALAERLKKAPDQQRLFAYGLAQGQRFIDDLQAKRISQAAISSIVPMGVMNNLEGPSADFMLGRIYASASESALRDVYMLDGKYLDDAAQEMRAGNKFTSQNCDLVGR
ncbi:hypothetical protein DDE05_18050 [Streptomyces cavourensis]|nr:hypothetical protein DDE05_18050 [Streptomyces cavourensis]